MPSKSKRQSSVRRLLFYNLFALFGLFFIAVVALWALGLLGSVLAFIF